MTKKPLIGITYSDAAFRDNDMRVRTYVARKYYQSVQAAGADAIMLPPGDTDTCNRYLSLIDGLLLPGGEDIDPRFQDEDPHPKLGLVNPMRDSYELEMAKLAYEKSIPILGICRGIQVLAIALGGKVHQDISNIQKIKHSQEAPRWATCHKVSLDKKSHIADWLKAETVFTNSFHHQAVNEVPQDFKVTGKTSDGIIEVIESLGESFALGVQWHPEETAHCDKASENLFKGFVNQVRSGK